MAHKGILTKGAKFSFGHFQTPGDPGSGAPSSYTEIANVLRLPSLGGTPDTVEVTTLADSAHQYILGLIEYGELEAQLLWDNEDNAANYRLVKELGDEVVSVQIELGDKPLTGTHGTQFTFAAQLSASLDEQEPNNALTWTCRMALQSEITAVNPA